MCFVGTCVNLGRLFIKDALWADLPDLSALDVLRVVRPVRLG